MLREGAIEERQERHDLEVRGEVEMGQGEEWNLEQNYQNATGVTRIHGY